MCIEKGNIRLVKVNSENFDALVDLEPFESQADYVANNVYSLAEAYANIAEGRFVQPFGIYDNDIPVGFLMIGFNIFDEEADKVKFPLLIDNYLIWRFMIDKNCQNKGYGKKL